MLALVQFPFGCLFVACSLFVFSCLLFAVGRLPFMVCWLLLVYCWFVRLAVCSLVRLFVWLLFCVRLVVACRLQFVVPRLLSVARYLFFCVR